MLPNPKNACSIFLKRGQSSRSDSVQVVFLPEGTSQPPHLKALMGGSPIADGVSRMAFDAEGRCFCWLGVDSVASTKSLRLAAARCVRMLPGEGQCEVSLDTTYLVTATDDQAVGRALAEGMSLAMFDIKLYRGSASTQANARRLEVRLDARFHKGFRDGLLLASAVNHSRELTAMPPNRVGPTQMAAVGRALAKNHGMKFRLVNANIAARLGMGGLLSVGAGSADPPCLAVLEWCPPGTSRSRPVLLVGKSVTYDSGGYSIKPDGGKGMKADKAGACTMLGVMEAIALKKLPLHVVCILAIAENVIDANAYRLDDIVTHCNGITCEVSNTDAEGRLILADALAWGTATYKPRAVIDAATLTGGVIVALGRTTTGVFCNHAELMAKLIDAAALADEKVWQLPLDEELRKRIRSNVADLLNSPPERVSLAGIGAAYLSYFVGENAPRQMPDLPWIHLDIAGTATCENQDDWDGLYPKGPTGWGIRTLVNLLADLPESV